jgi:protein subunit release factor A
MSRELLFSVTKKDLEITWFSGKGAGGQHRNKHQNCCRIKHPESGVIVTGQEEKSRDKNLRNAFKRLTENKKFKTWLKIKTSELMNDSYSIEEQVNNAMREENLKVEYGKDIDSQ